MSTERIKEEVRLHTEVLKFLQVILLASAGGLVTLYNIETRNIGQSHLITIGWLFIPLLMVGILGQFLYIYTLLSELK